MVIGILFFILEAKFVTHGILTTGGAAALALGAVMLIDTGNPDLRIRWATALGLAIPFALITSFLFSIALRARRNKVVTGIEGMVGEPGLTVGELNPAGTVLVQGEYWNAESSTPVGAHKAVRITGVDGLKLRVTPEQASSASSAKET
jgi:membrane-bound serine protease (ClpP class)